MARRLEGLGAEILDALDPRHGLEVVVCDDPDRLRAVVPELRSRAHAEAAEGTPRARSVVTLASAALATGEPGESDAAARSGAIVGLTRTLARELGPLNIRVNAVLVGAIDLGPPPQHGEPAVLRELTRAVTALGRLGTPDEVAAVIAFLASDDAAFVTGAVVAVTGGHLGTFW